MTQGRGVYSDKTVGGAVRLVGMMASGEVAFEFTVAERLFHPAMEARCWRYLDRLDPTLRLVSSSE